MCDFQPGDVVVCVKTPAYSNPRSRSAVLCKGAIYNVSEVKLGELPGGVVDVVIRLAQTETHWIGGDGCVGFWRQTLFRRVYRPDGSLISKLLEPVDLGEEAQP